MNIDRLAVMANDVSALFAVESPPERAAAHAPSDHRAVQALAAVDLSGA